MKSKRLLLLLLMAIGLPWAANAQSVTIGSGTDANKLLPGNTYYNYAISQQIYTAAEINASGNITSIAINKASGTHSNRARKFDIYMAHTTKTAFDSNSDWIALTDANIVYHGTATVDMTVGAWTTFTLDTPFNYNGTDNLVICVIDRTGSWTSSGSENKYLVFSTGSNNMAIHAQADGYSSLNPNGTNGSNPLTGTRETFKNQIILGGIQQTCAKPTNLTATLDAIDHTIATLDWTENGEATSWVLQVARNNTFTEGLQSYDISTTPSKNLTGLTPETTYYARVRPSCSETAWSDVCEFKPTAAIPQTVCDGTVPGTTATTNGYVPVYGNYAENYNKDEFIIPATTEGMDIVTDGTIQGLTFYLYSPASDLWGDALYRVFIKEVNESAFANTSYYGTEGATIVYEGALDGTHSTMTIDFTTDYVYNGGNLLVGIYEYNKGTFKSCSFSGIESTNGSMYKNNSTSLESITTGNLQNFIPKTTFTYLPSATPRPRKLQVSDISSNGATVSWQAPANATPTSYQYRLNNGSNWTGWESTADLSVDLNLSASTPYTVQVKAIYGAGESVLVETSFTTLDACAYPTNLMPYTVAGEGTTATLSWRPGYDETAWVLQYATKADFSEGLVEITNGFVTQVVEEVTYILRPLTGLTPEQTYYARVKANCDGPTSEWSNVVNFTPTNFVDFHFMENATGSSYQIPFYYYTTYTTNQSQFVIPAAELADLNGGTIRSITYYTSNTTITDWGGVAFDVYMAEVENAVFSSATFIDWTTLTQVYSGTVSLDNGKMTITFDQNYTYNGGNLLIGFQNKTVGTSTTSMSWRAYTSGSTYYGVYQYGSSSSPTITRSSAQPKITINYQPSPYRKPVINEPQCTFGTTTAHIAWTVSGGATPTGYQFQYKPSTIPTWPTGWNTVETNYKDLVELTPGIFYDFRVKALYEGNHESNTVDYKFVTACADIVTIDATHSWSEGFEGYNDGTSVETITDIHCWDRVQVNTTTTSPFVYTNYGSAASTGTASLELKTNTTPVMVALPEFSAPIDNLNVAFNYNCTSTSSTYTAELGYITDVTDATTFVKLLDIPTPVTRSGIPSQHTEFSEDLHGALAAAAPEHSRIAIRFFSSYTTGSYPPSWNFDDFVVSYATMFKPTNLNVDGLTASTVTLSWTETGTATSWQICLNDDEEHLVAASTNPFTIPGLTEDALYTAKVRSVDGSSHSAWSTSVSFEPTDKITIGSGTSTSTDLPAQCNYDYSYSQQIYTVAELGDPGVIESIDFYMTGTGDYTYYMDIYMVCTDKSSFTGNTDWIAVTDNDLVFGDNVEFHGNAWTTITLDNGFIYDGTKNVAIIVDGHKATSWSTKNFRSFTVEASQSHYSYQDNTDINPSSPGSPNSNGTTTTKNQIRILKTPMSDCMKPTGLTATEVRNHSAKLSWTENGAAEAWVIDYNGHTIEANTNPFTLPGLDASTSYTVKVRPACDTEGKLWSNTISFTTEIACPAPTNVAANNITNNSAEISWEGDANGYNMKYREAATPTGTLYDFEDGMGEWTTIDADNDGFNWVLGSQAEVYLNEGNLSGYGYNGSSDLMASGSYRNIDDENGEELYPDNYLVSPKVTLGGTISFYACGTDNSYYSEHFGVFVSTNSNDNPDDFVMVNEWTATSTSYTQYSADLSAYSGHGYVAIRHFNCSNEFVLCVDNITITDPVVEQPWTLIEDVTSPQPIPGLTAEITYEVQVQAVCGGIDGESDWTTSITFTTLSNCAAPGELNATDITSTSATLSWTGAQDKYNVRYSKLVAGPEVTISENFESYEANNYSATSGDRPSDWAYSTGNTSYFTPQVSNNDLLAPSYYGISGMSGQGNILYMLGAHNYAVMPRIENLTSFTFKYAFENASNGTFKVGYVTNASNISGSFTQFESVNTPGTTDLTTVTLTSTELDILNSTDGARLAFNFNYGSSYGFAIDDISYTTQSFTPEAWNEDNVNVTSPLPINGLEFNTKYVWQVQGINAGCGDEGLTEWSEMANFTTPYPTFTRVITGYGTNEGGYVLLASPLAGETNPTNVENMIDAEGNYDLYYFDQAQDLEWINYKDSENGGGYNLVNGKGYLYANKNTVTLTFTGAPYNGTGVFELTYSAAAQEFPGLNLIGNPFAKAATLDKPFYKMNDTGDGFTAKIEDLTNTIAAMEGVFVEATTTDEKATFTAQEASKGGQAIAQTNIVVSGNKGQVLDNAIIRFDGGQQLGKFSFRQGSTKVFITEEGKDYAVVNAGHVGEIPVSFKAEKNGSYTMSFTSEEVSFSYLHLIDNMTGEDVDLLANPIYSFDARTTDYESRFRLVFATGSSVDGDNFAFINGAGNLSIFGIEGEATLQVMDINGRILSTETFSGSYEKKINGAAGIYMVRLINGNDVKVQKIVVR